MNFDAKAFLANNWGDPDSLLAFLHAYGHPEVKRPTVNQWFRRGRIPGDWQATLIGLIEMEAGREPHTAKYLK